MGAATLQVPKFLQVGGWMARGFKIGIAARRKAQASERCKVRARIWYYRDGVSPRWAWKLAATERMSTNRTDRMSPFKFTFGNTYSLNPTGPDRYWDSALLEVVTNGKCRNAIAVVYSIVAPEKPIWPEVLEWLQGGRVGATPTALD